MNSNDYYMFIPLHPCPVACLVRGTGNVDGSGTVELYTGCNQGGLKRMKDDILDHIRTAINAEIEELHCNSGKHSYDVQVNAIMIVE